MLAPLRRVSPAYEREVEAVFALIAYEAPAESPLQHLIGDRAREVCVVPYLEAWCHLQRRTKCLPMKQKSPKHLEHIKENRQ